MARVRPTRRAGAERAFALLRRLHALERKELAFLRTLEDRELLCEIGHRQAADQPLSLKEAFLLPDESVATVQRRLRRLRESGIVELTRSPEDRRIVRLRLTPKALQAFANYATLLEAEIAS